MIKLYEHRKRFQEVTSKQRGGCRDALRDLLEEHYTKENMRFSRSFVVERKNDACAAAFAFACGVSVTFEQSHADCRQNRPRRRGRAMQRDRLDSVARTTIEAHIADLCSAMEGSKGGASAGLFYTGKRSVADRWDDFKRARQHMALPVVVSLSLFQNIWSKHAEIRQYSAKSYPACDNCGKLLPSLDRLGERTDAEA
eukprot:1918732-Pleurochrysis_carterae.AAC.1